MIAPFNSPGAFHAGWVICFLYAFQTSPEQSSQKTERAQERNPQNGPKSEITPVLPIEYSDSKQ